MVVFIPGHREKAGEMARATGKYKSGGAWHGRMLHAVSMERNRQAIALDQVRAESGGT